MLVLTGGIALLIGGFLTSSFGIIPQLLGWHEFGLGHADKIWSLGLVVASAAGFVSQGLIQGTRRYYGAAATLLAVAIPMTLSVFQIELTGKMGALIAATVVFALNAVVAVLGPKYGRLASQHSKPGHIQAAATFSRLAIALLTVLALSQFLCLVVGLDWHPVGSFDQSVILQFAMTTLAATAYAWNYIYRKEYISGPDQRFDLYASTTAIAASMGILTLWSMGLLLEAIPTAIPVVAPIVLSIFLAVARFCASEQSTKVEFAIAAAEAMSVQLLILATFTFGGLISIANIHLVATSCLSVASAVYLASSTKKSFGVYHLLGYASAIAAFAVAGDWVGIDFGYCIVLGANAERHDHQSSGPPDVKA